MLLLWLEMVSSWGIRPSDSGRPGVRRIGELTLRVFEA